MFMLESSCLNSGVVKAFSLSKSHFNFTVFVDEISVMLFNFATARIESYLIFQPLSDGGSKLGSRNTFQSIPNKVALLLQYIYRKILSCRNFWNSICTLPLVGWQFIL